ncbi:MAG: hypothetical protein ACR2N6_03460 [Miltoncostaeaceae bacterium]
MPLRALLAAILALAALALVPQVAMGNVETPTEEPAPPPEQAEAAEGSEGEETEGSEGQEIPPAEEPPVEEPPVEETPPEGTEEEQPGEVVPPPVEETPPPPAPEPVPIVIEEEVVQTEILVIPETPDVPVAPKAALSKQVIGPPPGPPIAPDRAPALPTLKATASPGPLALPAPSLVDTPPAIPPSDPPPPVATTAPPAATAGTPLVEGISRFVPTLGVEQSRPDAEASPVIPSDGTPVAPVVDPNIAQDELGQMSRPDSLIGVLASYVIPGASGPASSFQFMLAFALLLGAFAFARPRNWVLALPDVPGRAHAGHGSVGLRPG